MLLIKHYYIILSGTLHYKYIIVGFANNIITIILIIISFEFLSKYFKLSMILFYPIPLLYDT